MHPSMYHLWTIYVWDLFLDYRDDFSACHVFRYTFRGLLQIMDILLKKKNLIHLHRHDSLLGLKSEC